MKVLCFIHDLSQFFNVSKLDSREWNEEETGVKKKMPELKTKSPLREKKNIKEDLNKWREKMCSSLEDSVL